MNIKVKNSKHEDVEFNRSASIGHDEHLVVAGNRIVTVEGQQDYKTTGNHIELIEGDSHRTVKGDLAQKVDGTFGLATTGSTSVISDEKITLRVGGNFIVIHSGGININGNDITAGPVFRVSAEGAPGALVLPNAPAVLKAAAGMGTMFVAHCPMSPSPIIQHEEDEEYSYSYYAENDDGEPVELNYRFDTNDGNKLHEAKLSSGKTISLPIEQESNIRFWINNEIGNKA